MMESKRAFTSRVLNLYYGTLTIYIMYWFAHWKVVGFTNELHCHLSENAEAKGREEEESKKSIITVIL